MACLSLNFKIWNIVNNRSNQVYAFDRNSGHALFRWHLLLDLSIQYTEFHTKEKHLGLVQKTQFLKYSILVKMLNVGSNVVRMVFRKETMDNHLRYLQSKATNEMTQQSSSLRLIFVSFAFHMMFLSLMSLEDMHSKQYTLI